MLDIKYSQFFDRAAIKDKIGEAKVRTLSKAGAFVRRTAKGLIRSAKKPAKPGKPPKSHVGLLKDWILFAYDNVSDSVVIGAKLINGKKRRGGSKPVPQLLEEGGDAVTDEGKPAHYHAFPYMQPALEAERDKFPDLFANSVR